MAAIETIILGNITNAIYDIAKYVTTIFIGDNHVR